MPDDVAGGGKTVRHAGMKEKPWDDGKGGLHYRKESAEQGYTLPPPTFVGFLTLAGR